MSLVAFMGVDILSDKLVFTGEEELLFGVAIIVSVMMGVRVGGVGAEIGAKVRLRSTVTECL